MDTLKGETMSAQTTQEKLQDEIARLQAINAELLAALESIVTHQKTIGGSLAAFSCTGNIAKSAIAKATKDHEEETSDLPRTISSLFQAP